MAVPRIPVSARRATFPELPPFDFGRSKKLMRNWLRDYMLYLREGVIPAQDLPEPNLAWSEQIRDLWEDAHVLMHDLLTPQPRSGSSRNGSGQGTEQ